MFTVCRYTPDLAAEWDAFVAQAKNATFLFRRGYMDYHADRFHDASLMVYGRRGLFAVMPANAEGDTLWSHHGLTYGGLVLGSKATTAETCEAMAAVNAFLRREGFRRVVCKALPAIYATQPSDEPLYAYTEQCHARLLSRDVASVVCLASPLPLSELRRRGCRKAQRHGVTIAYSDDLPTFWHILTDNLRDKYDAQPVHTLGEIQLLRSRFTDSIRLCAAFEQDTMVAGTLLYVTPRVVKTQYISASPRGKELGALDLLFSTLIACPPQQQAYLDMGTSALEHSTALRLPLIFQKEGFGARAVCYDTYEWTI